MTTSSLITRGAFERICSILSNCNKNGLVFYAEKFRFARKEVEFAGFMITEDGIKPAAKYTASINDFPTPEHLGGESMGWARKPSCALLLQN